MLKDILRTTLCGQKHVDKTENFDSSKTNFCSVFFSKLKVQPVTGRKRGPRVQHVKGGCRAHVQQQ